MNEIVTELSHAQCELCKMVKTVRMIDQSANNRRDHRSAVSTLRKNHSSDSTHCFCESGPGRPSPYPPTTAARAGPAGRTGFQRGFPAV